MTLFDVGEPTWWERAEAYVVGLGQGAQFSPYFVRVVAGDPDDEGKPNGKNNTIGVFFSTMRRRGLIEPVLDAAGKPIVERSKSKKRKGGIDYLWRRR